MQFNHPIGTFFDEIREAKRITKVILLCERESEYLNGKYNTSLSSLKNAFTKYRNYAKQHLNANKNINKTNVLATVLSILRLTKDQQDQFKMLGQVQLDKDLSNLRDIYNVDRYIEKAVKCLDEESYFKLIIGLCALTGRRIAEIACTAKFKYVDDSHVEFQGQLKLKARDKIVYNIPVLADSNLIIDSLEKLRMLKPEQTLLDPEICHDKISRSLNRAYRGLFDDCYEAPHKPKDMRSIYATICYMKHSRNSRTAQTKYVATILGHGDKDNTTALSYEDFRLINIDT